MNLSNKQLSLLAAFASAGLLTAHAASSSTAAKTEDEIPIALSPFLVSDSAASLGRYDSMESISAGRVRTDIMDSSQSVSVITNELLEDIAPGRLVEAAKYVAGVTDSTLPTSWERTNMRGFQAEGRTVDGITYSVFPSAGFQNLDPAIIERIEIVKGPNSILSPQPTSPGGTINHATKKPQFRDFGLVGFQAGRFDANSGFVDVNRVVRDRIAVRFVGSMRDYDHWWNDAYVRSITLMPGVTYRISKTTQLTFQYVYTDWKAQNYFGLPIDPTSGTTTKARLLAGVPRDLNIYGGDLFRFTRQHEFKLFFTAELGKGIQTRLVAACNTSSMHNLQLSSGKAAGDTGGNIDPLTGNWNYGLRYAQTTPFASSPITTPLTRSFLRSGTEQFADPRQWNLQNDYVHVLKNDSLKATTLAGVAYADFHNNNSKSYNLTAPAIDLDHYVDTPWTRGGISSYLHNSRSFLQGYLSENLAVFQNRLILNAANSWQHYDQRTHSQLTQTRAKSSPGTSLPSWGVVLKPLRDFVSLYYAHTEQSSANTPSSTGSVPPLSTSRQKEFGARFKVWENRLYLTASHFAIVQDNFSVTNPGNLTTPPPTPRLPNIYVDRDAEGWEFELRAHPAPGLSVMAAYTQFKNRDPNNVRFWGVAEKAGSLLASYTFTKEKTPMLAGFRVAVGADHLGNRPGDTATTVRVGDNGDFTVASTLANPIPKQPSFYLDARTLVSLILAFDSKHHWGVQANVDNLFDREYLMASVHRYSVFPGTPRNLRVSVRYGF